MIRYRPFRNCDPPALADVWCSQPPQRWLAQGVSAELLERMVLSKPYFDRQGLIVAEEQGRLVGFVHAGFGPSADRSTLSNDDGVTSLLLVSPHSRRDEVAGELLTRSEQYLEARGAKHIFGGGHQPLLPFYLGLYGGSSMPGILDNDVQARELYRSRQYEPVSTCIVMQRQLAGFRPIINRDQMQIRRKFHIEASLDPPAADWWDACTLGAADRAQFALLARDSRQCDGRVVFWEMEALSRSWGVKACGICHLSLREHPDSFARGVFLLGESLRQLQSQAVSVVEVQRAAGHADLELLGELGFDEVERGTVFRKPGAGESV